MVMAKLFHSHTGCDRTTDSAEHYFGSYGERGVGTVTGGGIPDASDRLLHSLSGSAGARFPRLEIPATIISHILYFYEIHPKLTTTSPTMSAIGSLVFCTDCGNLLDGSAGKQNVVLTCTVCGANCKGRRMS